MVSIAISILIAILGLVPSFFITAANILFFGFWPGTFYSFLGEAMGAGIAFLLYRAGLKKNILPQLHKHPRLSKLLEAPGKQAAGLVFLCRLIPFIPSGLVTFAAAIGRISFTLFFISSSVGKIPALLLEAYSVNEVSKFDWQGKLILGICAVTGLIFLVKKIARK
ncbi:MAG: hypothetical protein JWQ27_808 [Ferruginibacter sp.]|nr:hypothetical protein [Ferruginibacter sp.]